MRCIAQILQGAPVAVLNGDEAPYGGGFADIRRWATGVFRQQGGKAVHPELGEVMLDQRAVRDSLSHGMYRSKAAAFALVKDVIEHGVLVMDAHHGNMDSFFISAPVRIAGEDSIATALIRRTPDTTRLYLHSVSTKESLLGATHATEHAANTTSGYTGPSGTDMVLTGTQNITRREGKVDPRDVDTILRQLLLVNLEAEPG